ncbi:hypothetical protein GCM10009550_05350 [Actinocorallia libanotica]|uniref:Uncharacterized protein n=1 Tax=Actinocorallia libanotica TaxID=46162 RepID=A0ABN1Q622_9ACTN
MKREAGHAAERRKKRPDPTGSGLFGASARRTGHPAANEDSRLTAVDRAANRKDRGRV